MRIDRLTKQCLAFAACTFSLILLATPRASVSQNFIDNGDFEQGNVSIGSQYTYSHGNIVPVGTYDVVYDPHDAHAGACSYPDHTSGSGLMLAANGATAPNLIVWSQTVPLAANTYYDFSLWISSWSSKSPAQLQIQYDGNPVGTIEAPNTCGLWQQFTVALEGTGIPADIAIIDLNLAYSGNDFAIDDISLTRTPAQLPDTLGLDVQACCLSHCGAVTLADDWVCTQDGWVKDIHFWGSWERDWEVVIDRFLIQIYSSGVGDTVMPDQLLWSCEVPFANVGVVPLQTQNPVEGWYDPCSGYYHPQDHQLYYQYNVYLPMGSWFHQEAGAAYWLSVQAFLPPPTFACWGWKTTENPSTPGIAVFRCPPNNTWQCLTGPGAGGHLDLAFVITGDSIPPTQGVPTLSEWGLIVLALLLAAAGVFAVLRRRAVARGWQ